ncbi:MAG: UDP-N-acetylmuramoyl-tripeptide--D-alanyl-D-alanine ligase [Nitrospirae bacterium]|nr:UDP-N-acetylmuramoyl-tripeptide--D-alanyl-D-alanine ligase [Nitrospirota bacterium]
MFRADELVTAIEGVLRGGRPDRIIDTISTDTRRIPAGALFWALRGERYDGARFVEDALANGACGAVVPEDAVSPARTRQEPDVVIITVRDTLRALQDAASAYRNRFRLPVVAVTGSNGKTTTKEMVAAILERRGPVLKTHGNLNNHIGVPLTLFGLTAAHHAAVVELGVNHPGEMTRLCAIARPTVGVITNVGYAHLEGLGGIDGVACAKGELFQALGPDGTALVNADDPRVAGLMTGLQSRVLTFGMTAGEVRGRMVEEGTRSGMRIEIRYGADRVECFLSVIGRHNAANALAAAAVGVGLGVDLETVGKGLAGFRPAAMRSELVRSPSGVTVLNDAYNANPSSMERALGAVGRLRGAGRLYAVLGDMLELGETSEILHRNVGRAAAQVRLDGLVTVGPAARWIADEAVRAGMAREAIVSVDTAADAVPLIAAWSRPEDLVLIKGSRRMGLERVAEGLGIPPDPPHR